MTLESLDAELRRQGVALVRMEQRPRFPFEWGWLLAPVIILVGAWVIFERAERRGREASVTVMVVTFVVVAVVLAAVQVRRVLRLRRMSSERYRLLGWVVPTTFAASHALSAAAGNTASRPRNAIVGLFVAPRGLILKFDHDGLHELVLSDDVPVRFGCWRGKRLLLVGPPEDEHALPIRRVGVPSIPARAVS